VVVLVAGLVALSAAGCADNSAETSGVGGTPGGGYLGGASATAPECGALGQVCLRQRLNAPLVAGGGMELGVEFRVLGSSGPPLQLESTDEQVLKVTGAATVQAFAPGLAGLLFVGPDDAVMDFLHVWVERAEELRIQRYSPTGTLLGQVQPEVTLLVGDEVLVAVEPYSRAQPLLGVYEMERSVEPVGEEAGDEEPEQVLAIVPDPVGGLYRVVARAPGQVTVRFAALELEAVWQVEVLP